MSQHFLYPAQTSSNISVGTNGATAPTSSTEVAGINPSGNLQPLQTDISGNLLVSVISPSGGATAANQVLEIADLDAIKASVASIDTKTPALGQALAAGSVPVVLTAAQLSTLTPLSTVAVTQSGTWNLNNISGTISLPTGASTSALQTTGNTSLSSIDTKTPALGQALAAASVPIVLTAAQLTTLTPLTSVIVTQATGTNLHVVVDSSGLPSGAATAANQATEIASLASIDTKTPALGQALAAASTPVVLTAAQITTLTPLTSVTVTQATGTNLHTVVDSGTVTATQSGTWNITNVSGTVSLPTGASTSALQTTISGQLPATLGQKTGANSLAVVPASDYTPSPESGRSKANAPVRNDYSSVNVTTGAYVQLVASTTSQTGEIEIFDSSGQTLVLAVGAAASEVDQINIFPGGNGRVALKIPASSRVSIKAVSATASTGEIDINFYT